VRLGVSLGYWDYYGGRTRGVEATPSLTWRPSGRLTLAAGARLLAEVEDQQFLDSASVAGRSEHVVGELHQSTAALTLRGDFVFTPKLSLQLYAEPFASAGRYGAFRRVVAPRAGREAERFETLEGRRAVREGADVRLDVDGDGASDLLLEEPEYRRLSLRSNLVLRWEYRPSSTLFLVWQQDRDEEWTDGRLRLGGALGDLARAGGRHSLLVKLTYWWNAR
jgi:hypothetical protein